MAERVPAEAFPLALYLREELEARGQTPEGLCHGTAMPPEELRRLLDDPDAYLSVRHAEWLGYALGVSPGVLLGLQHVWRSRPAERPSGPPAGDDGRDLESDRAALLSPDADVWEYRDYCARHGPEWLARAIRAERELAVVLTLAQELARLDADMAARVARIEAEGRARG